MSATISSVPSVRSAFADKELLAVNGYAMLAIGLASIAFLCCLSYIRFDPHDGSLVRAWIALSPIIIAVLLAIGVLKGLVVLQPNESLVCLLFGSYVGTQHRPGFWWVNPFNSKNKVSRRLETLESGPLKVNDAVGNPIDIGAVIVWRVEDAAKALLEVASYASYVKSQSETALRRMVSVHPYDLVETEEAERQGERLTGETGKPDQIMRRSRRSVCATVATRSSKPCCSSSAHAWSRSVSRCSKHESPTSPIRPRSRAPCSGDRPPAPWLPPDA